MPRPEPASAPKSELVPVALVAVTALIWLARRCLTPVTDYDLWLHLRLGAFLRDGGRFDALPDPFAAAATTAYVPNQWLAEIAGVTVFDHFGYPGIAFLRTVGIVGILVGTWVTARRVADPLPAAMAALVGLMGVTGGTGERPQLAGLVFLTAVTYAGWGTLRDGRARWWLVPLAWIWAMIHGLWIIGLGLYALFALAALLDNPRPWRARLRPFAVVVVAGAATMLTPLGPKVAWTPFAVQRAVGDYVREWQPVTTRDPLFLAALLPVIVIALLWWRSGRPVPWSRILLLAVAFATMVWMGRLIAVGTIIAVPLMAEAIQRLRAQPSTPIARSEGMLWSGVAAVALIAMAALAPRVAGAPDGVPRGLTAAVQGLPTGTVILAEQGVSGWVQWEAPQVRPILDLRTEIYSPQTVRAYVRTINAQPGWADLLTNHGATAALLPSDSPLGEALRSTGEWRAAAAADDYILYVRGAAHSQPR